MRRYIILSIVLMMSIQMSVAGDWANNTSLVVGLPDVGDYASPTIFYHDNMIQMISGQYLGVFTGYDWNGSGWNANSTLISGLSDVGANSAPTVFYIGSDMKLISGMDTGGFVGYDWNGTGWISNATNVNGIASVALGSTPDVFYIGSDMKLISGMDTGEFVGYDWNGTGWISNATMTAGLFDIGDGSSPTIFYNDTRLELLTGEGWTDLFFYGFYWNGSGWINDNSIGDGLIGVSYFPAFDVYENGDILLGIQGEYYGNFYGSTKNITLSAPDTNITSCGVTISSNGIYELLNNITNSAISQCIVITSSNVILNGNNYVIDGTDTADSIGTYVLGNSLTNISINNITLTDWDSGIKVLGSDSSNINNLMVDSVFITSNVNGIYNDYVNDSIVTNSIISENTGNGIFYNNDAYANSIVSTTLYNNSLTGIYINGTAHYNYFIGCDIMGSVYNYKMQSNVTSLYTYVYNPASLTDTFGVVL